MKELTSIDGKVVIVTEQQLGAITALMGCRSGGIATVHGYKPSTKVSEQPVYDINMITKISTKALYQRKMNALNSIKFDDVLATKCSEDEKLNLLTANELLELLNTRKEFEIASMQKTLDGVRDDNYRKAHSDNYASFDKGLKANVTLLENGKYIVKSIMLTYVELSKKIIQKGSYKTTNSRNPVRMSNVLKSYLNSKSHTLKTLALKEDNFNTLKIDRNILESQNDTEKRVMDEFLYLFEK